jgi:hypothetical protein
VATSSLSLKLTSYFPVGGPETFAPVWELSPQTKFLTPADLQKSFELLATKPDNVTEEEYGVMKSWLDQDLGQTEVNWVIMRC